MRRAFPSKRDCDAHDAAEGVWAEFVMSRASARKTCGFPRLRLSPHVIRTANADRHASMPPGICGSDDARLVV